RYDLIAALDVIEHLDAPVASLRAMRGALAGEGRVIVTVPAFDFLWSEHDALNHHRRRYSKPLLLAHLSEAGLRAEYVSYFNAALFAPIAAARLSQNLLRPRR